MAADVGAVWVHGRRYADGYLVCGVCGGNIEIMSDPHQPVIRLDASDPDEFLYYCFHHNCYFAETPEGRALRSLHGDDSEEDDSDEDEGSTSNDSESTPLFIFMWVADPRDRKDTFEDRTYIFSKSVFWPGRPARQKRHF